MRRALRYHDGCIAREGITALTAKVGDVSEQTRPGLVETSYELCCRLVFNQSNP